MSEAGFDSTSITLLARLRTDPGNPPAWKEFVRRYGPLLQKYCENWGLQEADAQDIAQEVLIKLVDKLKEFRYDASRSFRAWLKTVTRHVVADEVRRNRRVRGAGGGALDRMLESVEGREGVVCVLEAAYQQELLEVALKRVRASVPPQQWDAFRLTALEGLSGLEASQQLAMPPSTVYSSKSKVQKRVCEELERLDTGRSGT